MIADKDEYHSAVVVEAFSKGCDFCKSYHKTLKRATVDGKTIFGYWANMCEDHFNRYGLGLGIGKGQRLVTT